MNKLDIIKYYTEEIEKEVEKLNRYEKALTIAKEKAEESNKSCWYFFHWNETEPSKTKIKDFLKNIRRLSLEIEKEIK